MSEQLEGLLQGLREQGRVDSEGRFSLDLDKAMAKLQQFQLPSPYHYVLNLVAAAASLGATRLSAMTDSFDTVVSFDGRALPFESFRDLFGSLLVSDQGRTGRHLRELAVAVHGARHLEPEFIRVESFGETQGARLFISGNQMTVEHLGDRPWSSAAYTVQVHVRHRRRLLSAVLRKLRDKPTPEESLLQGRCRFARMTVRLNGHTLNATRLGPWSVAATINRPSLPGGAPAPQLRATRHVELSTDEPISGYVGLGKGSGGCLFIVDDVTHQLPVELGFADARAVVHAPQLSKDLSQSQLRRDQAFERTVECVKSLVLRLADPTRQDSPE